MEYATTPENKKREQEWYNHNDLNGSRPMVTIEEWTFFHEVKRKLTCETEKGREFENKIVSHLIGREDMDDDRATPGFFSLTRPSWFLPFGVEVKVRNANNSIGYEFLHTISDLERDFHKLGKSTWGFSKEVPDLELAQDIFGDIMPVVTLSDYPGFSITQVLVRHMSMETMLFSMYDYPNIFHQMIKQLTDDMMEYNKEREEAGYFITNNLNQSCAQGTYSPTNLLIHKDGASLKDMWGYADSQETVGISPEMFEAFIFPYYKQLMDTCGKINYGCCEPVDTIWDNCLSKCANISKLSVSPWCNEEFIGDRLRGTGIIYHRKPSPNLLGDPSGFDEKAYADDIIATLKAAKGCVLEFSLRDIYSLSGEKNRAKRAVAIIKECCEKA